MQCGDSSMYCFNATQVAIGTIRRYGIAADVLITLGGVGAAANDDNAKEAARSLTLARNSLDEIITICKRTKGFA